MGLPFLFWLCAAPLFCQLIFIPFAFYGLGHLQQGACGAVSGLLLTSYFYFLWRTWRQSLVRIEDGRRAAVAKSAEADAANAVKSEFLATMSHEIRTPLNGMLGMVQALVRTPLAPAQREMVATIDDAGLCLLAVLDGVLDIAKLDSGRIELDPAPFRLDQMLTRAAALFQAAADAKGLTLSVGIEPACARMLVGDDTRLRQIVVNLLSNAVKFTSAGEVGLSASLTEAYGRADLAITVHDTGAGMSQEVQDRLFRRFEQGDSSITRRFGGTGLGLAIARDLMKLMGGQIQVDSRPGEGAQFRLRLSLPFGGAAEDAAPVPKPRAATAAGAAVRILAAEDNPTNQLVLRTLLGQLDIDLTLVDNGAQALACRRDGEFDVILMDLHMPVMDGMTAARAIRAYEAEQGLRAIPMIALTADAMTDTVARCGESGMNSHVAKPIRLEALLDAIDDALGASAAAEGVWDPDVAAA
jgi:signal transduction histidine kinase/ActR/RegA family two-component response regulator